MIHNHNKPVDFPGKLSIEAVKFMSTTLILYLDNSYVYI